MGAIVLDASKVNSYVLPNLVKSKNTMQEAYSTGQSLRNTLPNTFQQRSVVNDIVNQIYNIKREISDIDTIVSKKVEKAKNIESKSESRVSSIATAASKIGSVVGTIAGTKIGLATGGVVGAAAGAVVGNKVGSSIGKAIVNTGAKIVDGAVKVGKTIWDGIKSIGNWIWDGCKKVANAIASFIKDAVSGLVKAAKAVWDGLKWVGKQIYKAAASVWNVCVSFVKGFISLFEALIVDAAVLVVGGFVGTVVGACVDLYEGVVHGEWDWSATGAVWKKGIMPIVSYDVSDLAFDWMYSDAAYEPFKKDGIVCQIAEGVGYYTGMIVATTFTAGAASAAGFTGVGMVSVNTVTQGGVAAVASLGKNVQKNYNSTIDQKVKDHYVSETMKSNPGITLEEAILIVEENLNNGVYSDESLIRKKAMDDISGGEIAGNIGKAAGTAVIDGGIYFAAGAAGDAISTYKTAIDLGQTAGMSAKTIKVVNTLGKNASTLNSVTTGIKASKAYISEGYNCLITGENYDFAGASIDAASTVIAEKALFKLQGTNVGSKVLGEQKAPTVKTDSPGYINLINKLSGNPSGMSDSMGAVVDVSVDSSTAKSVFTTFKENFNLKDVTKKSLEKGIQKGKEKATKDATSALYDSGILLADSLVGG